MSSTSANCNTKMFLSQWMSNNDPMMSYVIVKQSKGHFSAFITFTFWYFKHILWLFSHTFTYFTFHWRSLPFFLQWCINTFTSSTTASVTLLYIQCLNPHVCQSQTQATEKQIREEFEQLREFLQKEEAARLAALQQEDEEKKELVKRKSDSITSAILTFSHAVIAIENEIASSDALFLKVRDIYHPLFSLNSADRAHSF